MSTLLMRGAAPATGPRKAGFAALVRPVAEAMVAEWRARRAARRVAALSDAGLHDIGLTRSEIDSAVRYGRAEPMRRGR